MLYKCYKIVIVVSLTKRKWGNQMIVYSGTKKVFSEDVLNGTIADKIKQDLYDKGIHDENTREYMAWTNSMRFMKDALDDKDIPDNVNVSIEYEIPLTSKRVDFIIAGSDELGDDNVIIIELKQWTTAEKVNDDECHTVKAFVAGKDREVPHPCYQAYSYKVHIMNYAEAASDPHMHLIPCAFCHNFREEDRFQLENPIYSPWLKEAPLFLKQDLLKLTAFIKKRITKVSPNGNLLYEIDSGRIRPTKALQDCLSNMMKGKQEFILLDDQITVYDRCLKAFNDSLVDHKKRTLIVQGGPGTGKSVLAINLLCTILKEGKNVAYVTKNSAPRNCYVDILAKGKPKEKVAVKELFRSPFGLCHEANNVYDCLIVDEAHRLVKQQYGDFQGVNQIKECIDASLVSIFFIDETQRITTQDIGSVQGIKDWAIKEGISQDCIIADEDMYLRSEFRCNGSDGYLAFLDNLLGIRQTANRYFDYEGFDIKVFDNPCLMREELRKKNTNNKARMVAGYCFDWNVKHNRGEWDIVLDDGKFKAKWNLTKDGLEWAIKPNSFDEVGCIHTSQGLEFDYVGVIIGDDLLYRNGKVITNRNAISRDDNSSKIRTCKDSVLADQLIRNTYKVLLTRGQKGCYIYCTDTELRKYLKEMIVHVNK